MNWIKVGEQFINMALVTQVLPAGDGIRLYFQAPATNGFSGNVTPDDLLLEGKEAAALKRWLSLNAENIDLAD